MFNIAAVACEKKEAHLSLVKISVAGDQQAPGSIPSTDLVDI